MSEKMENKTQGMTKEEAAVVLSNIARLELGKVGGGVALACVIAIKALLRAGIHRRRTHASRKARGVWKEAIANPPFVTPPEVAEVLGIGEKEKE